MSLLEQDTTRKGQIDKDVRQIKFDVGDNDSGKYKVEVIWDSAVYGRESESGHLSGHYYLVSRKEYAEEENTSEPTLAVQYLRKLISSFHKNFPDKPTATSLVIDIALPMAKLIVKPTELSNQNRGRLANSTNK